MRPRYTDDEIEYCKHCFKVLLLTDDWHCEECGGYCNAAKCDWLTPRQLKNRQKKIEKQMYEWNELNNGQLGQAKP